MSKDNYHKNIINPAKRFITHENRECQFVSVEIVEPETYKKQWTHFKNVLLCDKTVALLKDKNARWDKDVKTNVIVGFWIKDDLLSAMSNVEVKDKK